METFGAYLQGNAPLIAALAIITAINAYCAIYTFYAQFRDRRRLESWIRHRGQLAAYAASDYGRSDWRADESDGRDDGDVIREIARTIDRERLDDAYSTEAEAIAAASEELGPLPWSRGARPGGNPIILDGEDDYGS